MTVQLPRSTQAAFHNGNLPLSGAMAKSIGADSESKKMITFSLGYGPLVHSGEREHRPSLQVGDGYWGIE